ncbi:hypothetical protein POTOM_013037 [Populus tomentosa]|uniref:TF-B3 domain-containing protein n=1 Tax=Populus tomentosa TaxID=118781 RepID=A0A8X8A9A4_POPTO|nr:hypothetical protein POTOM_013037 [Populus tomentosa]
MAAIFFYNGRYIIGNIPTLERGLVLPPRSNLEHRELSTIVESSAGTRLPDLVTIHCSTTSGRLVFTRGWHDIARHAGLKSGDTVTFYQEVNEGAQFKLKVRHDR